MFTHVSAAMRTRSLAEQAQARARHPRPYPRGATQGSLRWPEALDRTTARRHVTGNQPPRLTAGGDELVHDHRMDVRLRLIELADGGPACMGACQRLTRAALRPGVPHA